MSTDKKELEMRMKCICLMLIVLVIILSSPIFANSPSDQYSGLWQWRMFASASNGSDDYSYWDGIIGAFPQASDGYDGEPLITSLDTPTTYAAVFQDKGTNGWDESTGFYRGDYVGLLAPRQTKTWQIYVWSTSDVPYDCDTTYFVMDRMDNIALTGDFQFRLMLKSTPSSMIGGPDVGTAWNLDASGFEISFPTYRTDEGLTGYHFELSAMSVPEPSSILAFLASLGGFGILLKRRAR